MEKQPLIAKEPGLVSPEDFCHTVEKIPNLFFFLSNMENLSNSQESSNSHLIDPAQLLNTVSQVSIEKDDPKNEPSTTQATNTEGSAIVVDNVANQTVVDSPQVQPEQTTEEKDEQSGQKVTSDIEPSSDNGPEASGASQEATESLTTLVASETAPETKAEPVQQQVIEANTESESLGFDVLEVSANQTPVDVIQAETIVMTDPTKESTGVLHSTTIQKDTPLSATAATDQIGDSESLSLLSLMSTPSVPPSSSHEATNPAAQILSTSQAQLPSELAKLVATATEHTNLLGVINDPSKLAEITDPSKLVSLCGGEKLRAGQAEMLSTAHLISRPNRTEIKDGKNSPRVAIIPPYLKTPVQSITAHKESRLGEGKSPHPKARRIWMSSCRPLDPSSLERIGADSKGNVYWYDGGKNMFLSPPCTDSAYKPSESELQLVCKSMVQWTAKLKELRMSNDQQTDIKLAQTIKDHFISRVRIATQRKPRDVSVLKNLQAIHGGGSLKNPTQQHIVLTTSDGSKTPQFLQGAFPQGSIVLVPPGGTPFPVIPMFGSNAMMFQKPGAAVTAIAGNGGTTSVSAPPTVSSSVPKPSTEVVTIEEEKKEDSAEKSEKIDVEESKKGESNQQPPVVLPPEQPKIIIPQTQAGVNMPVIMPPNLLSSMINYQQAVAFYTAPVCTIKVTDPVKMEEVNFESKSIEISGEVPIKKVAIDTEETCEDIEVTDNTPIPAPVTTIESDNSTPKITATAFQGHSSAEVMSAQLLLSLTERSAILREEKPSALNIPKTLSREEAIAISTPITTAPSSARKRKQTPIASARPGTGDDVGVSKAKKPRKSRAGEDKPAPKRKTVQKKNTIKPDGVPQQLPPGLAAPPLKPDDGNLETSQATASMLQLKASRVNKPMKEYVIETDSESESSSSDSSGESSSESSSDSSSDEEEVVQKKGVSPRGRGRGRGTRGRGRGGVRPGEKSKASSEDDKQSKSRGRGRGNRKSDTVVSIPTDILETKPNSSPQPAGKKKIQQEGENKRTNSEFVADVPTDLASLYAKKGGVDLNILSELTQSVSGDGSLPTRSKRTCVQVRQQITKLQEILGDEADVKGAPGSKVKGRGGPRAPKAGGADVMVDSSSSSPAKKHKKTTYSQFTNKRRKKRKNPEEEALWAPAKQSNTGEKFTIHVFSTSWANKAAEAVEEGIFENIVKFHNAQPKGPGYHMLDPLSSKVKTQPPASSVEESNGSEEEAVKSEVEEEKQPSKRARGGRQKPTPAKKSVTPKGTRKTPKNRSPPIPRAFLRSSSRLRKRNDPDHQSPPVDESPEPSPSPSPPPAPTKRTRANRAPPPARTTRNTRRKQLSPENYTHDSDSESGGSQARKNEPKPASADEYNSDEELISKKAKLDDKSSPIGSSPGHPPKDDPVDKDEVNYTICHGTPGNKTGDLDSYPRPKGPVPLSNKTTAPSEPMVSPESASESSSKANQPPSHTEQRAQQKQITSEHTQGQQPAWSPSLGHQFASGYHSVYNPAALHYPGPGAPGIHGSNYPYAMAYPWGPGSHHQLHEQSRHGAGEQYMRGADQSGSPHGQQANAAMYQHQHRGNVQSSRQGYSSESPGLQQQQKSGDKPSHSHPPSLHPLASPVSGSSQLGPQATHAAFAQSPSGGDFSHFGPQHHSSHPFPYGFDHNQAALQQMHLWQTQQMQSPHMSHIRASPISPHMHTGGIWNPYGPSMTHFNMADHYKKATAGKAKPQEKPGANHNTNNNNNESESAFLNVGPHLAKYQAKAFPGDDDEGLLANNANQHETYLSHVTQRDH